MSLLDAYCESVDRTIKAAVNVEQLRLSITPTNTYWIVCGNMRCTRGNSFVEAVENWVDTYKKESENGSS